MRKSVALIALSLLAINANAGTRTWDFTNWSDETIKNLKEEASLYADYSATTTLWRSFEKTNTDKDNTLASGSEKNGACYWYGSDITAGTTVTANGTAIKELEGLEFGAFGASSLAIAINYSSTTLGNYDGAQYLWLGGSGNVVVIPEVAQGSTIKMKVETHKNGDDRGVKLTIGGEVVQTWTPTSVEEYSYTMPTNGKYPVDVTITNTSGCHLYYITVEEPEGSPTNTGTRVWDFTSWSETTTQNLATEAAEYDHTATSTLWRAFERTGADAESTDRGGACYWYGTAIAAGTTVKANGYAIEELDGLRFGAFTAGSLAIAINYPSTSIGNYAGPQYLWLGGNGGNVFVIPNVKPGATITMEVESHRISDGRGVGLTVNGTAVEISQGSEKPTTKTTCVWNIPESISTSETVDVTVTTNNGCHIYSIIVEETNGGQAVTIGETGFATFVATHNIIVPEDVEVYTVAVDESSASISAAKVETGQEIISGEALLVKGTEGSHVFAPSTSESHTFFADNDLLGSATEDKTANGTQYILAKQTDGTVGFQKAESGTTIPAGKAYLDLSVDMAMQANEFLALSFGEATGIEAAESVEAKGKGSFFNLKGVEVSNPAKGLFVKDGKIYSIK